MAAFLSSLQDTRETSSSPGSEHMAFVQVTAVFCIAGPGLVNYKTPLISFLTLLSGHRVAQLCKVVMRSWACLMNGSPGRIHNELFLNLDDTFG